MQLVLLLKSKLIYLDNVLPLTFSLVSEGFFESPILVLSSPSQQRQVEMNRDLIAAIEEISAKLICLNKYNSALLNKIYNVYTLRFLARRPCIVLECALGIAPKAKSQSANRWGRLIRFLGSLNRKVFGGIWLLAAIDVRPPRITERLDAFAAATAEVDRQNRKSTAASTTVKADPPADAASDFLKNYDGLLQSYPKQMGVASGSGTSPISRPTVYVGNTRRLEPWQRYLDRQGRVSAKRLPEPYFFFALSTLLTPNPDHGNRYDDALVRSCLQLLKVHNNEIATVFKPHAVTDMQHFQWLLDELGYKNYIISYSHPMILMKNAKFCFSYYGTTLFLDAYFLGCPTVEFTRYDSRGLHITGDQSLLLDYVDYFSNGDEDRMQHMLHRIVHGDVTVERDPDRIEDDFTVRTSTEIAEEFLSLCGDRSPLGRSTAIRI